LQIRYDAFYMAATCMSNQMPGNEIFYSVSERLVISWRMLRALHQHAFE
jgi:hypothetical protein